ncbi:MAG TPA: hypothetical protein VN282_10815 [Pyrinomonadaceae bacterium]|nr:hypothetical protein [Pyrinomonadaceae bacterium]
MRCLSSPKVRLALIVNGLYFISLLTPPTPHTRPRLFARASSRTPPIHAPLAPPDTAPAKAAVNYVNNFDQLDVYLTNDLTLVRKPGHTLLFSPTFTTKASVREQPRSVLLRFVSFSEKQFYTERTPLLISANGAYKWNDTAQIVYGPPRTNTGRHSVTTDAGGSVVETVGVEIPYDTFLEIISARRVIVELGEDTAELNSEQIEALRDMHRRLPQQPEDPPPPADPPGKIYGTAAGPKTSHDNITLQPSDRRRHR